MDHRTKLLRSTYSCPYDWLFPFGKRDQIACERNEVLVKNELSLPKLLRVRVFFDIKEADRNILIDMHRTMGYYWISVSKQISCRNLSFLPFASIEIFKNCSARKRILDA